jgi:hypothetical protein
MALPFFNSQRQPSVQPGAQPQQGAAALGKPFEICRPGIFVDANGRQVELSEAALREMATSYNPKLRRAPLVIGHPKMDDPAFGWVKELDYRDGALVALTEKVDEDFAVAVQAGRYANRSASFYVPDSSNNPTPGRFYLKHVGFLGARQPAVDGLKPLEFSALEGDDANDLVVSLAGWEAAYRQRMRQEIEQENAVSLAEFEQQVRQNEQQRINRARDMAEFCDAMVEKVIIRPGEKEAFIALAQKLIDDDAVIQFGEGEDEDQGSAWTLFKRLIESRPPLVMRGEFTLKGGPQGGEVHDVNLAMPEGIRLDSSRADVHNSAVVYQGQHNCSYREAVLKVTGHRK